MSFLTPPCSFPVLAISTYLPKNEFETSIYSGRVYTVLQTDNTNEWWYTQHVNPQDPQHDPQHVKPQHINHPQVPQHVVNSHGWFPAKYGQVLTHPVRQRMVRVVVGSPFWVEAVVTFLSENGDDEISLKMGNLYKVLATDGTENWLQIEDKGSHVGWCPTNFIKKRFGGEERDFKESTYANLAESFDVQAIAPYVARNGKEINLEVGKIYTVIGTDARDTWWHVSKDGKIGWIPAFYVELVVPKPPEDVPPLFEIVRKGPTAPSHSPLPEKENIPGRPPMSRDLLWEGTLVVYHIKGQALTAKDRNGLSDPYAVLKKGDTPLFKTKKIRNTVNPVWNDLMWSIPCTTSDTLILELHDWDRVGPHSSMGEIKLNIQTELTSCNLSTLQNYEKKFPVIYNKKGGVKGGAGTLELTVGFQSKTSLHFGRPLLESMGNARKDGVVHVAEGILRHLIEVGTRTEGVIRIPGNKTEIFRLYSQFDAGQLIDLTNEDIFDLVGLLKVYLSVLPDALVPERAYLKLNETLVEKSDLPTSEKIKIVKVILKNDFPKENLSIFGLACRFFLDLVENQEITKMTANNIGISIGPTILLSPELRGDLYEASNCPVILKFLLGHYKELFE